MKELLKELSLAFGPSGCEDPVKEIIEKYVKENMPKNASTYEDGHGGFFVHVENTGKPKLMMCAHMDEVGFMVTHIEDSGLLRFGCVGGIDPIVLAAKRVVSENGHRGSIIAKPVHLLSKEERNKKPSVDDMLIDIGATSREDAEKITFVGDLSDRKSHRTHLHTKTARDSHNGVSRAVLLYYRHIVTQSSSEVSR